MTRAAISIIVPAYNAEATLGGCLAALREAMEADDELILYDDASTDGTQAIAAVAGARIMFNQLSAQGPAHGRNEAARLATHDRILFVDADVLLHHDAIDLLAGAMDRTGAVAAFGSYDDRPRSLRSTSLYANLRHHFMHQSGRREATTFWSGIGMIEKHEFLAIGGFNREMFRHPSIEDVELGMRLVASGGRIILVPEAQGTHWKDWTLWRVWHTDVVRRALPWSKLIADGEAAEPDLNLMYRERLLAGLAVTVALLTFAGLFVSAALVVAPLALGIYIWANRGLFEFFGKRLTIKKFVVAMVMHWCYHIYASAAFASVIMATRLGLRRKAIRRSVALPRNAANLTLETV